MNRISTALLALALCGAIGAAAQDLESVRIALDWTPNTNHTGIFVSQELGYFAEEGLDVIVVEPGPTVSIQLVASGRAEFGVSMQEYVTMARAQRVPVVSIATIFQHNTSGFAAPVDRGIASPEDFAGKRYAGWGSALEEVMIATVMAAAEADFASVTMINIGTIDFATAVRRDLADFYWIFYGWQGIHAELQGIDFVYMPLVDLAEVLDYYTPVIVTGEEMIAQEPEVVARFVRALARGSVYAALQPVEAAEALLRHAPELDSELVYASQQWLAGQAVVDLAEWGQQDGRVWERFADWALENGLIERAIDPWAAFSNDFLPQAAAE